MAGAIELIGAPSSAGAYAPGQEDAPGALRARGLVDRLTSLGVSVTDHGDTPHTRWRPDRANPRAQNTDLVVASARALADCVAAVAADDRVTLVLGGDCTIGLGTIAGWLAASQDQFGLLYFDMHADLNTPSSVADGALDWMGLAHALAEPDATPELIAFGPRTPLLAPEQILIYGFREDQSTAFERDALVRHRLDVVPLDAVTDDPTATARDALTRLSHKSERILVHFDVDVIDFTDAPLSENTGRNIGLSQHTAFDALRVFAASDRLAAITITEVNPHHGEPDNSTLDAFTNALADALA